MKEYLSQKGVEFEEFDVAADSEKRQEMIDFTGKMVVPIIRKGDDFVVGFDKEELDKIIS